LNIIEIETEKKLEKSEYIEFRNKILSMIKDKVDVLEV
jgi:hypothetical protein